MSNLLLRFFIKVMENSLKNYEFFFSFFVVVIELLWRKLTSSYSLYPVGNSSEVDTRLSIGSKNFTHGELQEFKLAIDN